MPLSHAAAGWAGLQETNIENIKLSTNSNTSHRGLLFCVICRILKPQVTQSAEEAVSEYSISSSDDASSE